MGCTFSKDGCAVWSCGGSDCSVMQVMPLLPLRDVVVFPHMVIPLFVGRPKSIRAMEIAMEAGKSILLVAQKVGGVAAGAFDGQGKLMGFVFGLTGVENGAIVHWSDMLAVRPEPRPFPALRFFGYAKFNPALEDLVERADARGHADERAVVLAAGLEQQDLVARVFRQASRQGGTGRITKGDQPGIAIGPQILARIKAEAPGASDRPGTTSLVARPVGLARILNHGNPMLRGHGEHAIHVKNNYAVHKLSNSVRKRSICLRVPMVTRTQPGIS